MAEKATSILDRIKQLFADALPTSYKLADGTEVTISLLDIGGDFTIGGLPATEGTYTLMDGTNVTVDSTGKITEVADPSDFAATEYKLSGGDAVTITKLDIGGIVKKGDVIVAEGDYALEDGTTFTTDVNGVIVNIAPPVEEQAEMSEEQAPLITREQVQEIVTDALNSYKQKFEADQTEVSALKSKVSKQEGIITKQGETITQMLQLMTELAEAPAGDPPARKILFSGEKPQGKKTAIDRYAKASQVLIDQQTANK